MTSLAGIPINHEPQDRLAFRLQFYARRKVEKYRRQKLLCWYRYRQELQERGRSQMARDLFDMALWNSELEHNVHWAWEAPR